MILIVGEAPNATTGTLRRPDDALTGAVGRRIAELAGVDVPVYLRRTERVNLLADHPAAWPYRRARLSAESIADRTIGRRTILLTGRAVDPR